MRLKCNDYVNRLLKSCIWSQIGCQFIQINYRTKTDNLIRDNETLKIDYISVCHFFIEFVYSTNAHGKKDK